MRGNNESQIVHSAIRKWARSRGLPRNGESPSRALGLVYFAEASMGLTDEEFLAFPWEEINRMSKVDTRYGLTGGAQRE